MSERIEDPAHPSASLIAIPMLRPLPFRAKSKRNSCPPVLPTRIPNPEVQNHPQIKKPRTNQSTPVVERKGSKDPQMQAMRLSYLSFRECHPSCVSPSLFCFKRTQYYSSNQKKSNLQKSALCASVRCPSLTRRKSVPKKQYPNPLLMHAYSY